MGKKSLIKSTDKKKREPTKKESAAKKTTPKNNATTKKAASTKKATTKKTTAKKSVKKVTKKVTMKELIFKKFEPLSKQPAPEPAAKAKSTVPPAPEIITSNDPRERERLRALLMAKYSMEDIKAAAKAPEPVTKKDEKPEPPVVKPADSPKAAAPEAAPAEVTEDDSVEAAAAIAAAAKPVQPEKTAAPKPTMAPRPSFDSTGTENDPVQKALKCGVVAFVVLILLLVGASYKNSSKYYIVNKGDAVEIWRGRFSPTGKERLIILHGISAPEGRGTVYTRNHVFPLAFNYYLEKADALLDAEGIPDYKGIRDYLRKAKPFAIDDAMKDDITARLNNIDLITLIYKIDVSLSRNTTESLDLAAQLVKKAAKLTNNAAQGQLLTDKAAEIKERRAALAAAEKQAEAAETQEAVRTEEPSSPEK